MYMNGSRIALNNSGIGEYLGDVLRNYSCYADDMCLISMYSFGMQQLLNMCQNCQNHHLLYESFSLCLKKKHHNFKQPSLYLYHLEIFIVEYRKYFGKLFIKKKILT